MNSTQETTDVFMEGIQQRARQIADTEPDKRDALFTLFRDAYLAAALETGMLRPKAAELADLMVEWIRAMVTIIERERSSGEGRP